MTKKKPLSSWTWQGYTLQLSIVIIGVMVTFIGSSLFERMSRSRQVKAVMQLIVSELEMNRNNIRFVCDKLTHDRRGMLMFNSYGYEVSAIPVDSLLFYNNMLGEVRGIKVQSDALEVLKSSGLIASIDDKQMLLELLGCYNMMVGFGRSVDQYNDRKIKALNHFTESMSSSEQMTYYREAMDIRASWGRVLHDPLCMVFITSTVNFFGESASSEDAVIVKTIDVLKEKYNFK